MKKMTVSRSTLSCTMAVLLASTLVGAWPLEAGINRWSPIGPPGSSVVTVSADLHDPQTIYVGTDSGLTASRDGGYSWRWLDLPTGNSETYNGILQDPMTPGVFYVTLESVGPESALIQYYKTSDGGESFLPLPGPDTGSQLPPTRFAMLIPADPPVLVVSTNDSYRTADEGATWQPLDIELEDEFVVEHRLASPVALAERDEGSFQPQVLMRSVDLGETWLESHQGLPTSDVDGLALDPLTPGTLWAVIGDEASLYRSTDSGQTWQLYSTATIFPAEPVAGLQAVPAEPGTFILTAFDFGYYRTTDYGVTWTPVLTDVRPPRLMPQLAFGQGTDGEQTVFAGAVEGLFLSGDGGATWREDTQLQATHHVSMYFDPWHPDTLWIPGGHQLRYRTLHDPTWYSITVDAVTDIAITSLAFDAGDPDILYVGTNFHGLYRSLDRGETWTMQTVTPGQTRVFDVHGLSAQPGSVLAIAGDLWKSLDRGDTWSLVEGIFPGHGARPFREAPSDPNRIYANGTALRFRSFDGGDSWQTTQGSMPILAIDRVDPARVYALGAAAILRSEEGGESGTWTVLPGPGPDFEADTVHLPVAGPNALYAGGATGIYRSLDKGLHWQPFDEGLEFPSVRAMVSSADGQTLVAGTAGGGLWVYQFGLFGDDFESADTSAWSEVVGAVP